jgi:hypothetical protein
VQADIDPLDGVVQQSRINADVCKNPTDVLGCLGGDLLWRGRCRNRTPLIQGRINPGECSFLGSAERIIKRIGRREAPRQIWNDHTPRGALIACLDQDWISHGPSYVSPAGFRNACTSPSPGPSLGEER